MNDPFSLVGRTAIVTGGGSGLGKMMAGALLDHGCRVYIIGRSEARLRSSAEELDRGHQACFAIAADVTTPSGRATILSSLQEREPRLDILINNAGWGQRTAFGDVTEGEWDIQLDVNLKAPFFLTQLLYPLLLASVESTGRPSKVINIASADGLGVNRADTVVYQTAKAALIHLTRSLGAKLAPRGVMVSCIAPGAFPSDLNVLARDRPDEYARFIPAGRVGTLEDIGSAAVFLAARSGDYIAGETIAVDGGFARAAPTHGWR